jgi:hypothetical protein
MAMKSSYDLAMEKLAARLPQSGDKLTREQKVKLAKLDNLYKAKTAERELDLKPRIAAAQEKGDAEAAQKLEQILRAEIAKLHTKLEEEKEKVRRGK